MNSSLRQLVAPAYLLICLLLGGSSQGYFGNLLLQLCGLAILAWSALDADGEPLTRPARQLLVLAGLGVALVVAQLIPLPPAIWSNLPGREFIVEGFATLGQPLPWLPVSLAPFETFGTLLGLVPPLAMLAAILRLRAYRRQWLAIALVAGTIGGVLLGVLQVSSASDQGDWYLYRFSNFGVATGFFANANHMATLLVATIPFLAALLAATRRTSEALQRYSAAVAAIAGTFLVVAVGLLLNGSLAGFGLGLPVVVASGLLIVKGRGRLLRMALIGAGLLLAAAVVAIYADPSRSALDRYGAQGSVDSRREMTAVSLQAARDFAPVGSGMGTYEAIYVRYENPTEVNRTYVNHAHNDYLEPIVEAGLAGLVLIVLFLAWWLAAVVARWRSPTVDPYARAATIASAAILIHSLVDFPLRTASIAVLFAMCVALVSQSRPTKAKASRPDLWPTRHLEVR